ncbi:hypothetical protein AQJ46_42245 [Streptomyces canus]|uniref:SWIM-type domain-containing protein n=1 Tax=Streptomyces canus TaxID=58343 RepID=A0A101RNM9_9ACTN|nr:hypothetical protein [Streptomyces canus]KUN58897.1 hypothetical protein AQJ46_42245 [Streptomyces canus]
MTPNAWAHTWETILRASLNDEALWLAGHNDLSAGGLTHLTLEPGRVTATATDRHHTTPAHPTITMPVLTDDQTTAWQSASPACGHHQAILTGKLPECLTNPAHTGGVPTQPAPEEITFSCDCGIAPCRHIAALTHAVTARLTTRPADFATLRGLPEHPPQHRPATSTDQPVTTTRTTPGGKVHIPAHHAWAWYRECSEPPLLPTYTPDLTDEPVPNLPAPTAPPAPAPEPEQIHALISDAAAQARAHLRNATQLECALHEDALRLAAVLPGVRLPETAERLAIDVADLREQISAYTPTYSAALTGHLRVRVEAPAEGPGTAAFPPT